jgi:histidine triad (HIT) family protein
MEDCIFCKIANREINSELIYEDDEIAAFNDLSPQAPTHILLVPRKHIESTENLNESNYEITGKMIFAASKLAKKLGLEGYRLVFNCNEIAGQTVFHLHCHMLGGRVMEWPPG